MASGIFKKLRKNSTEEEILQLVDDDEEVGELDDSQREMINNIFEFDDINAGDIMTHRTDIEAVEDISSIEDVVSLSIKNGFSRIPIFHENLDNIVGVIYVKDLLKFVGCKISSDEKLMSYVRKPLFVPETMACGKLFELMTSKQMQFSIVVDEYGGTAGIVTMEDLLESIVGNIRDEYDNEKDDVNKIDEKTYTFEGTTDIEDASKILGVEIPEGEYDTLAGFVISLLGYLPDDGKEEITVDFENIKFTILKIDERRIEQIRAEIN